MLVFGAGIFGYRLGQLPDETETILHYAERYVAARGRGATLTDCVARGGEDPVWITVVCTHPEGDITVMPVGRRGQLLGADDSGFATSG